MSPTDRGRRETITFSAMPYVAVGGVSEDWSTTAARDVGCLEPSRAMPPLSSYNTDWHGIEGSGAAITYATRSLASSAGGYSIQETTSNLLWSGVCAQGHKPINGSRYRIVSVAYGRDFAPASGITTPALHMADPDMLFSGEQRRQLDAVLASLVSY